jgi:hypothetical protein
MKRFKVKDFFDFEFGEYVFTLPGLPLNKVGILHSIGGVGKSYWAMQSCFQVAAAGSCDFEFNAISSNPAPPGGRVVYISFEDDERDFGRRAQAFYKSFQDSDKKYFAEDTAETFDFIYMDDAICYFDRNSEDIAFTNAFKHLAEYLKELKCTNPPVHLIVFDTLSRVHRMDENSNKEMAALISWFERLASWLGCSILILHHDNKSSMNLTERNESSSSAAIRGASALSSNVRWHASLRVMSQTEALKNGIPDEQRRNYLRIELDKTSYSPPIEGVWLRRIDGGVLRAAEIQSGGVGDV